MTDRREFDDAALQAYLDGELDPGCAAEIEAWLSAHPKAAARVEAWRRNDHLLRAALDPALDEPIPPALNAALFRRRPLRDGAWRGWAVRAAAAVILIALGASGGWLARERIASTSDAEPPTTALAVRALDAHVVYAADLRHPIEVPAAERDHLNTWLSRRIRHPIAAPDLASAGYALLGGRLLSERGKPTALFMYEDGSGKRLTVLVAETDAQRENGVKQALREDLRAISWSDGPLTLAVTAPVDGDRLRGIGDIVRTSVNAAKG